MKNLNKNYFKNIDIDNGEENVLSFENFEKFDIIVPKEVSDKVDI